MELIHLAWDYVMHMDHHLGQIIAYFGPWVYVLFFMIIFCETGLVVTPILPGDSLIFATGTFAALGSLNAHLLFILLTIAAILGDTVNYWIGHFLGPKVFSSERLFLLNKKHLEKTHRFYERHGGKTIILARFIPIIRTFAPFVAGIGTMNYLKFISYNVIGGVAWVGMFVYGGYFFGNLPMVRKNFTLVILGIIFVSILPAVWEFLRHQFAKRTAPKA
ncbi:MAG: DedA family protein [candidate division FCPU426 bacterium]